MKKRIIIWIVLFFNFIKIFSQNTEIQEPYFKTGLLLGTNHFGAFYRQATPYKNNLFKCWELQISGLKHEKEKKINGSRNGSSMYTFGKVNRINTIKFNYGFIKPIGERQSNSHVGFNLVGLIGAQVIIVQPIYVSVFTQLDTNNTDNSFELRDVRYNPETIPKQDVMGRSNYFKGFNESNWNFGLHFKGGTEFYWGNYFSDFKSLEVGFQFDFLPSQPIILHNQKKRYLYSSFYISFAFGKFNP